MYIRCELLVTEIKEQWVPVDDGPLKSSVKASIPSYNGNFLEVFIHAGDETAPYALAVHEHLSEHSPFSWRRAEEEGRPVTFHPLGRGPKFVQTPLLAMSGTFTADIAELMQR